MCQHIKIVPLWLYLLALVFLLHPLKVQGQQETDMPELSAAQSARKSIMFYNEGVRQENRGNMYRAVEMYETSLSYNPGYIPTLERMHDMLVMQGKEDSLRTALDEMILEQPGSNVFRYLRARLTDIEEADSAFRDISDDESFFYWGYFGLGQNYIRQGRFEEARDEFERVIALNPAIPEAQLGLGIAYDNLGDFEKAERQYEKTLLINADIIPEAYFHLGMLYSLKEDTAKVVENYRTFLDLVKQGPQADMAQTYIDSIEADLLRAAMLQPQQKKKKIDAGRVTSLLIHFTSYIFSTNTTQRLLSRPLNLERLVLIMFILSI